MPSSVVHGALYRGEALRSLAQCSADSHARWAAMRLAVCHQMAAAEETSRERVTDVIY